MVMIIDFSILGDDDRSLHYSNNFVVIPGGWSETSEKGNLIHLLVTNLHLRPFAPHFCKVFDGLKIDLSGLLEHLSRTFQVPLRFTFDATFLVEFGEVNI